MFHTLSHLWFHTVFLFFKISVEHCYGFNIMLSCLTNGTSILSYFVDNDGYCHYNMIRAVVLKLFGVKDPQTDTQLIHMDLCI